MNLILHLPYAFNKIDDYHAVSSEVIGPMLGFKNLPGYDAFAFGWRYEFPAKHAHQYAALLRMRGCTVFVTTERDAKHMIQTDEYQRNLSLFEKYNIPKLDI